MSAFGQNLFSGSRFLFWTLAPCLILGALAVSLPADYEDVFHLAAVIACDVSALLLVVSLWPYRPPQRAQGARRLLTGWIALLFTLYALDAWLPSLFPDKGAPSNPWKALAGLVVIGLPCWKYALLGRFALIPDPIAIPFDEPLLLEAYERARAELHRLPDLPRDPEREFYVRFAFETDSEEVEHLWGTLLTLSSDGLVVAVMTQPVTHGSALGELTLDLAQIEDFEFEDQDGRIVGGYTTRAMCAYAERESLAVPREIRRRLERYRDAA